MRRIEQPRIPSSLPPRPRFTALENNAARSGVTNLKLPCMLGDDYAPRFSVRNMRKDLRLALEAGAPENRTLTAAMLALYQAACEAGFGEEDFAAVAKVRHATD